MTTLPSFDRITAAGMYDCALQGVNHTKEEAAAVARIRERTPYYVPTIEQNRKVLGRMVRYLVNQGVRQFLDIGTGLPTQSNVHEVAEGAKVVYVDNDPRVIAHAHNLMAGSDRVRIVEGDARQPDDILKHPHVADFLSQHEPTGLLMLGILHFITDADGAYEHTERFKAAMSPGSYIAITHGTMDGFKPELNRVVSQEYKDSSNQPNMRTFTEILTFFEGCDLVPPGLVNVMHWRPDHAEPEVPPEHIGLYGGIGRIRFPRRG
ncbi:SAM-dependent methyltransferase [Nonomuraea sp. KM90]|uniref:SAM-dependent methyltransferase n=1 Tax=Nonomuraea sp. KM90 TaxID=3457428 RepID=UPI003FCED40F